MKHYRIEITGVGPASNGKPDTDADLLLQALLATLKSVGHKISKALITVDGHRLVLANEKGITLPPLAHGDPTLKEVDANVLKVLHLLTADKEPEPEQVSMPPKTVRKKKGGGGAQEKPRGGYSTMASPRYHCEAGQTAWMSP